MNAREAADATKEPCDICGPEDSTSTCPECRQWLAECIAHAQLSAQYGWGYDWEDVKAELFDGGPRALSHAEKWAGSGI